MFIDFLLDAVHGLGDAVSCFRRKHQLVVCIAETAHGNEKLQHTGYLVEGFSACLSAVIFDYPVKQTFRLLRTDAAPVNDARN